jgi:hypothetical protein
MTDAVFSRQEIKQGLCQFWNRRQIKGLAQDVPTRGTIL